MSFITDLFKTKKEGNKKDTISLEEIADSIPTEVHLDYDEGDPKNEKLLILDDLDITLGLYLHDTNYLHKKYGMFLRDKYHVVGIFNKNAGLIAYNYIVKQGNKIDKALLDITLAYPVKAPNGQWIEIDGVDVAIWILRTNPDAKIKFVTAHALNKYNPNIYKYMKKFKDATGMELEDNYISKNSDRAEAMKEFLL